MSKDISQKIIEEVMLYMVVCGLFYLIARDAIVNYIPILFIALLSGTVIKYALAHYRNVKKENDNE